jgi:GntR family transcriptional regulator
VARLDDPPTGALLTAPPPDGRPLYEKWAAAMAEEIRSGRVPVGHRMPSERMLAVQTGFSRLTVRRGLHELAGLGLLERARTRGWQVARPTAVSEPPATLLGFSELARSRGLRPGARVLDRAERPATLEEAEELRVAPGSVVIEVARLRYLDDEPVALERTTMSLLRFPWLTDVDWTQSIYRELDRRGSGPQRCHATLDVHPADDDAALLLGVEPGRGLLRMRGVTLDGGDVPVSSDDISYHPERYRYRTTLTRPAAVGPRTASAPDPDLEET